MDSKEITQFDFEVWSQDTENTQALLENDRCYLISVSFTCQENKAHQASFVSLHDTSSENMKSVVEDMTGYKVATVSSIQQNPIPIHINFGDFLRIKNTFETSCSLKETPRKH